MTLIAGEVRYCGGECFVGTMRIIEDAESSLLPCTDTISIAVNSLVPHGTGTMRYNCGTVYSGAWLGGLRHGEGVAEEPNGWKFTGQWIQHSPKEGCWVNSNGTKVTATYRQQHFCENAGEDRNSVSGSNVSHSQMSRHSRSLLERSASTLSISSKSREQSGSANGARELTLLPHIYDVEWVRGKRGPIGHGDISCSSRRGDRIVSVVVVMYSISPHPTPTDDGSSAPRV